jgi:hypothetical protein
MKNWVHLADWNTEQILELILLRNSSLDREKTFSSYQHQQTGQSSPATSRHHTRQVRQETTGPTSSALGGQSFASESCPSTSRNRTPPGPPLSWIFYAAPWPI